MHAFQNDLTRQTGQQMSRVEQSSRRSLILSRRVESRCRWNGTGWDKRKEASHHIDPIQSWSDRYDMIYLPGMNWWMNDDNMTIYSTKVAAAGVEIFVSTRHDKTRNSDNQTNIMLIIYLFIRLGMLLLYQSMQSIIFFSRHAFVSLFLCSFVIPFFLFAFHYITSWQHYMRYNYIHYIPRYQYIYQIYQSLFARQTLHGWTENTSCLEKSQRDWTLSRKWKHTERIRDVPRRPCLSRIVEASKINIVNAK